MPKLFIVDDETTFHEVVKPFFEMKGLTVSTAISGEEALPQIEKEKPEVILLDMHLKGELDGIGILRQIREKSPGSCVIMLTALENNLKSEALSLGAYKFLTKPITIKTLNEVISEVLANKAK